MGELLKQLMITLMIWISSQTGYNADKITPPEIYFMSPEDVSNICIDEGTLVPFVAQACYKLHKHSIYLRNDFDIWEPDKVGVLVHELTHVLQLANGKKYTLETMNTLEGEAETIEALYEQTNSIQRRVQSKYATLTRDKVMAMATRLPATMGSVHRGPGNMTRSPASVGTRQAMSGMRPQPTSGPYPQMAPVVASNNLQTMAPQPYGQRYHKPMTITEYYVSGSDYNRVASESVNLQQQLAVAQQEIRHLKDQIRGFQDKKQEVDRIKRDIADMQSSDQDLNSLKEEIEGLRVKKEEILSIKDELEALKTRNQELENVLAAYRKEIRRQDAILRSQGLIGADDTSDDLSDGLDGAKQQVGALAQRNQELENLVQKYKLMMMQQMSGNGLTGEMVGPADQETTETFDRPSPQDDLSAVAHLDWSPPVAVPARNVESGKEPYRVYIIENGDSLWKIARKFNVRESAIRAINDIEGNLIKPGWQLKIPYSSDRYSYLSRKISEKPANRPQMLR